jgi:hypothetical protein
MSRYLDDPRVTARPSGGYTVTAGGQTVHVLDTGTMGWGAYAGPNLDLIVGPSGPWIGIPTADALIGVLLQADNT